MSRLVDIITATDEVSRNTALEVACGQLNDAALLEECDHLDTFWRRTDNLYERVRALLFLSTIYRYHLPPRLPVDRDGLLERIRQGAVIVLDVRPVDEYQTAHIPGAVSVPLNELKRQLAQLPQNQQIVAYCRGPYCVLAVQAVELLRQQGFNAVRLEEGVQDWRAMGFVVAVGQEAY